MSSATGRRARMVAWAASLGLVGVYAVVWQVWRPYLSLARSDKRIAELRAQFDREQQRGQDLDYQLATLATPAGIERLAAGRGLGGNNTVRLGVVWEATENPSTGRPCRFERTGRWARNRLKKWAAPWFEALGREPDLEPSDRCLSFH